MYWGGGGGVQKEKNTPYKCGNGKKENHHELWQSKTKMKVRLTFVNLFLIKSQFFVLFCFVFYVYYFALKPADQQNLLL